MDIRVGIFKSPSGTTLSLCAFVCCMVAISDLLPVDGVACRVPAIHYIKNNTGTLHLAVYDITVSEAYMP